MKRDELFYKIAKNEKLGWELFIWIMKYYPEPEKLYYHLACRYFKPIFKEGVLKYDDHLREVILTLEELGFEVNPIDEWAKEFVERWAEEEAEAN